LQPEEIAMKKALLALPVLATLALAGCATDGNTNNQYARADCKVYPITTMSYTGVRDPKVDSLDQRAAEGDLAGSSYRFRSLARNGPANNNLEDIIRDCR
jgi:outer membrane lipoprotein SlyB